MAVLLIVALIVYGTLYPWSFRPNPSARPELLMRLFPPLVPRVVVDAVANVLIYVPLGIAVYLPLRRKIGQVAGALCTVAFAFALSFSLEFAQFFQPSRYPNSLDVVTNTLGGAVGVAAARLWTRFSSRVGTPSYAGLFFWGAWVASLTFPLIPALGTYRLRLKLANFAAVDSPTVLSFALQWLIAGVLLLHRRPAWLGATLLLIPAQLFVSGRQPTFGALAGALVGVALAIAPLRPRAVAATALALVVLWQLAPFELTEAHSFSWIPFADAMSASRQQAVAVVLLKCFAYGGCIALLVRAGARLIVAVALLTVLLAATEAAQIRIAERTPSVTDPIVAALAGAVLSRSRGKL
jgi:VanZ family protein